MGSQVSDQAPQPILASEAKEPQRATASAMVLASSDVEGFTRVRVAVVPPVLSERPRPEHLSDLTTCSSSSTLPSPNRRRLSYAASSGGSSPNRRQLTYTASSGGSSPSKLCRQPSCTRLVSASRCSASSVGPGRPQSGDLAGGPGSPPVLVLSLPKGNASDSSVAVPSVTASGAAAGSTTSRKIWTDNSLRRLNGQSLDATWQQVVSPASVKASQSARCSTRTGPGTTNENLAAAVQRLEAAARISRPMSGRQGRGGAHGGSVLEDEMADLEAVYACALERSQSEWRQAEAARLEAEQSLRHERQAREAERQVWMEERRALLQALERQLDEAGGERLSQLQQLLQQQRMCWPMADSAKPLTHWHGHVPQQHASECERLSAQLRMQEARQQRLEAQLDRERQVRCEEGEMLRRVLENQVSQQRLEEELGRLRCEEPNSPSTFPTFSAITSPGGSSVVLPPVSLGHHRDQLLEVSLQAMEDEVKKLQKAEGLAVPSQTELSVEAAAGRLSPVSARGYGGA
eukprot:gnl/TRDRNA2_/TRDRNA2_69555_c0_seq1.p1 gnl/TRDRNA2_/TRDRNA2_69555_c0~~gnl/TRDRNA2_/TRDRNA2_69555_c0_seq1.p1  ORF type:complete len:519 (+),score=103.81 gnl/TRDRNA2_/TRDRNA2_69555_c0_seq1:56-1612(+)